MRTLKCYHGTGRRNYEEIVQSGKFEFVKKHNHWLGNGIYFFIDDFERAKQWAYGNRRNKDTEPVVLYIRLTFANGELLDLDKPSELVILDEYAKHLLRELEKQKISIIADEHEFHCFLIDAFMRENNSYKAVCRTFPSTGRSKIGFSRFLPLAKQLCVYESGIIDIVQLEVLCC